MRVILIVVILVLFKATGYSQEYILGKSSGEVIELIKEAKHPIIDSGIVKGNRYHKFDVGGNIQMLCYYNRSDVCIMVRQLLDLSFLKKMIQELNYTNIPVKEKPNNWLNIKKTMRVQLIKFEKEKKFALDYQLIP